MSILKNLLGAFVEFKDEPDPKPSKVEYAAPPKRDRDEPVRQPAGNTSGGTSVSQPVEISSSGYQKHFDELIEEANNKNSFFQGTDFKEFIDSKSDVEAIADEPTKYRTAFNVLKRTGLTKERLIITGNEYLNVIDRDIKSFESVYDQQYRAEVEQKEQLLQQKSQELEALNQKIATLSQEIKQVSQDVVQSKGKLIANKNAFVQAGEQKKKEIKTELEKIDQYF
jgi:archaellum component FlaC